jgi:Hemingway/CFA97
MFRSIPVSNKKLSKIWNEKNQNIHITNLRKIKSRVDVRSPSQFSHLKFKAKNFMLKEERCTEIERENKILFEKITQISKNSSSLRKLPIIQKSLNKEARKRKLVQITIENQAMMRRIEGKKSSYNHENWECHRKQVEKMLANICEYPYRLGSTQKDFRFKSYNQQLESPKTSQGLRRAQDSIEIVAHKKISLNCENFLVEVRKTVK